MTVRYYTSHGQLLPDYRCQREGIEHAEGPCQRILGGALDRTIGELLVQTVSPLALEVALSVQDELRVRADEADRLRRQQVERARYEAELAQRRFLRVDPDNRLVADSLEAEWNHKLRPVVAAQEDYERHRDGETVLVVCRSSSSRREMAVGSGEPWHTGCRRWSRAESGLPALGGCSAGMVVDHSEEQPCSEAPADSDDCYDPEEGPLVVLGLRPGELGEVAELEAAMRWEDEPVCIPAAMAAELVAERDRFLATFGRDEIRARVGCCLEGE